MTIKKKRDIMFYVLVGFVCVILSIWMVSALSIKEQQNIILQQQLDSVIYITNILHIDNEFPSLTDTLYVSDYLPTKRIDEIDYWDRKIIQHAIIFTVIGIFVFLYIRCTKFSENGPPRCFFRNNKKKLE